MDSNSSFDLESRESLGSNSSLNLNDFLCEKLFEEILRGVPKERDFCRNSRNVCHFGAALVERDVIARPPNECLSCAKDHEFGQRKTKEEVLAEAEVVFVVGCDRGFDHVLRRVGKALKRAFKGIQVSFRVIFASNQNYRKFWPKFESKPNFRRVPDSDGNVSHSFDFLLMTSRLTRPVSRHVILVECLASRESPLLDFVSARSHFLHSNAFLHVLSARELRVRGEKGKHVIGVDWEKGFTRVGGERALRSLAKEEKDLTHVLAVETNGSVFLLAAQRESRARRVFARRVAANHVTKVCLHCDCALSEDHVTSAQECERCSERASTLRTRAEDQEWGAEDGQPGGEEGEGGDYES